MKWKKEVSNVLALYARKSVERENSISCETQIEYCKMMIRPEERGEKVVTFIDNGYLRWKCEPGWLPEDDAVGSPR